MSAKIKPMFGLKTLLILVGLVSFLFGLCAGTYFTMAVVEHSMVSVAKAVQVQNVDIGFNETLLVDELYKGADARGLNATRD